MQAASLDAARNGTTRVVGAPSPGLRPPSPKGRGVGFGTEPGHPSLRPPLPLGEGWGEGLAMQAASLDAARNGTTRVVGAPSPGLRPPSPKGRGVGFGTERGHPSLRPPLPLGEGWGEGPQCKLPVWIWDNEGCWGALTRPSATLSQRERGWIWDGTRPPSPKGRGVGFGTEPGHPLPKGRGFGFAGQAIRQQAVRMGSLHG